MMTESDEKSVEEMRIELQDKHVQSFYDTLQNPEDPSAERYSLIAAVSQGLGRLIDVEESFIQEQLENSDNLCLACFSRCINDHANVRAVASMFNHYISGDAEHDEE